MYHFIVNPGAQSGSGIQIWNTLEEELKKRNISYDVAFTEEHAGLAEDISMENRSDVASLAHRIEASCAANGQECQIVLLGGDGSLNEMMQGIDHPENITFGYIPAGSSNDFARAVGFSTDYLTALEHILTGNNIQEFDVGEMTFDQFEEASIKGSRAHFLTTRKFMVSCGIGFDADICEKANASKMKSVLNKFHLGSLIYVGIALNLLSHIRRVPCDFSVVDSSNNQGLNHGDSKDQGSIGCGSVIHVEKMILAVSMNSKYQGGGYMFCPNADPSDQLLDICLVQDLSVPKILGLLSKVKKGLHTKSDGISMFRGESFHIRTAEPMWVHTDGEVTARATEITVCANKYRTRFYL